jgi:hypothetical protein
MRRAGDNSTRAERPGGTDCMMSTLLEALLFQKDAGRRYFRTEAQIRLY